MNLARKLSWLQAERPKYACQTHGDLLCSNLAWSIYEPKRTHGYLHQTVCRNMYIADQTYSFHQLHV